jgi:hypothetical protein
MTKNYYKVEGHSQLQKNPRTGTIINTNLREIEGARRRKKKKKELESEIVDLKLQVERLTSAVEQLLEK